jgi:acetyltransferase-like isoleucine patch superfamily enzyme
MKVGGMSFSSRAIVETYKIRKLHHSLPFLLNELFFLRDWFAYKFFVFRKSVGLWGGDTISRIKGEDYIIDREIPNRYLLTLTLEKVTAMIYGMLRLRTTKRVFVSPSSKIICPSKIRFGKNLNIGYGCYINAMSRNGLICGDNVSMGYHTYLVLTGSLHNIADKMVIGNNVGLGTYGSYGVGVGALEIGDNTIFGNYVSIHPENHVADDIDTPIRLQGVTSKGGVKIGRNCWIGAKVTILDGTEIGDGCIVAAGAVVRGKFPDNAVIGGVPARILKMRK